MKSFALSLASFLVTAFFSHAELTLFNDRSAWVNSVESSTMVPILTQSFDGTDIGDTDLPVATETFDIFGNFSVYLETAGNVEDTFFDYVFNSDTDTPLDLGIDITGTDLTTALEFRFAAPQVGFAADFRSVDVGEGLTITLFNGTTPTGETVNLDTILSPTEGDGFIGFTTDFPFTSFAFSPLSETAMIFNLDEISTAAVATREPATVVPVIEPTSFRNGTFTFTVASTEIGRVYQIQSSADLSADEWTDTGEVITGTGGALLFDVVVQPANKRHFYRVKVTSP